MLARALLVPPLTSMSAVSNPVTSSEKVNVASRLAVALILGGTPPIVTVGASASQAAVLVTAAAGPVLRPSLAASCRTVTVTSSPSSGVTARV